MGQIIFTIAGMHRSGSSLVANWFYESGIFIGYNLYGSASSNKKGHFEDMDILNIHVTDLFEKSYNISGLYVDKKNLALTEKQKRQALKLIKKRKDHKIWGWKEPRTTLYLNSWKELIPNLKVIVLVRDEQNVVNSLYNRLKKNKWYYTRNPFKKIYWWFDIDLKPQKWKKIFHQTYKQYYQSCDDFKGKYPDDILIIQTKDFILKNKEIGNQINSFLKTEINFVNLDSIFEPSLYTK